MLVFLHTDKSGPTYVPVHTTEISQDASTQHRDVMQVLPSLGVFFSRLDTERYYQNSDEDPSYLG